MARMWTAHGTADGSADGGGARPRLIATDLDGTLLPAGGHISSRTRRALREAWAAGLETVFVTGRPPRWVDHLADDVGGHGVVICGNGAFVYDVGARRMLASHGMAPADARDVVAAVRAVLPGAAFGAEMVDRFLVEPPYLAVRPQRYTANADVGPVEGVDAPVGKLLVQVPGFGRDGMAAGMIEPFADDAAAFARAVVRVRDAVGDAGEVVTSGMVGLIEIGPAGVTKASALAEFCAERGVAPGDVWAFGDQHNDLAMLRWAGRSFAAGEAAPDVLAAVTDRCAGPEEDGVAQVLEWLVRGA